MSAGLTPFGTACRQHRFRRELVMHHQAKALRCSVAYISAIERGTRQVPSDYPSAFAEWLKLSSDERAELDHLARAGIGSKSAGEFIDSDLIDASIERLRHLRSSLVSGSASSFRDGEISKLALLAREAFGLGNQISISILDVLENKLHLVDPNFVLQVDADASHGDRFVANTNVSHGFANKIVTSEAVYRGSGDGNEYDKEKLAHEIGHVMLHGKRSHSFYNRAKSKRVEREANLFMREFLLPKTVVTQFRSPRSLAMYASVSVETAEMRMRELGVWPIRAEKERVKRRFEQLSNTLKGIDRQPEQSAAKIIPLENYLRRDAVPESMSPVVQLGKPASKPDIDLSELPLFKHAMANVAVRDRGRDWFLTYGFRG
ncbi:ImmA/IrrE family metallo-endopeptidase [Bradyrhizobium prioriisuperbiae]|uniref:ImmA/IrrE family metallo-endopeptidase n=1 Tax=Bradyrhizobium prioriisuperbiae TaxID=2854389 RepID=UPI0028EF71E5|nr:ImmA/IrrE family metallo-endopeptidase [Bradyrhizobium prioritasuperba]